MTINTLAPEVAPEPAGVDPSPLLLTVEEAARRLRIGRTLCYSLIRSGDLESVTIGSLRRVPPEAIPAFVAHLRKSNCAAA